MLASLLRNVLFLAVVSLISLVIIFVGARSCGLTPEQRAEEALLAELNIEEGDAYRSANAARPGVVTLSSGLQVEVLELGDGPVPEREDRVVVHYRGMHLDGRVFDSSYRREVPSVVTVEDMIPGWQEALVNLPAGSEARLVVPYQLGYGGGRMGDVIGPGETLIFELALLEVLGPVEEVEEVLDPMQETVPRLGR
ncbi:MULTISPECIES: FKBP-type peptidyl-prolyl cis-trans isomerase [unclassified Ectothiorhodospira]|uniref:FKBP-type peptidyl-prolyl cis-trans isomerase n=1 Tax=unclassified Ectothiorhodospira TaxID=2684909 RepID=UPI001EE91F0A|nr:MULTISPECIES: FKBP-type peptidyl-prolyl cis-trans isomerase [unclassified Ectothiorhodospira]MCG5515167.1 FKBP-type peptidyl-prolyl cis-trans isomerase [Ectothiorhodospira sp. 9100]MCG5519522.1 FKBP-type peptidyl-prolyl cis-trans isomerase [Ectothiorhodospira sp. 9905]